jgi:hypothetical protein
VRELFQRIVNRIEFRAALASHRDTLFFHLCRYHSVAILSDFRSANQKFIPRKSLRRVLPKQKRPGSSISLTAFDASNY